MADTTQGLRPDLSGFQRERLVCLAVSETQDNRWLRWSGDGRVEWMLKAPRRGPHALLREYTDGRGSVHSFPNLPEYLADAGAWGALLEKELSNLEADPLSSAWRAGWIEAPLTVCWGPWRSSVGEAICAAVLAKHRVEEPR